jgi:hypothetical protein
VTSAHDVPQKNPSWVSVSAFVARTVGARVIGDGVGDTLSVGDGVGAPVNVGLPVLASQSEVSKHSSPRPPHSVCVRQLRWHRPFASFHVVPQNL